jgi:hypothetical protein
MFPVMSESNRRHAAPPELAKSFRAGIYKHCVPTGLPSKSTV